MKENSEMEVTPMTLKNIQDVVQHSLQNENPIKAKEILVEEIKKTNLRWSNRHDFKDIFMEYPPSNALCPACGKKTMEHKFNDHLMLWEQTFCNTCELAKYNQEMNNNIDKIMSSIIANRYLPARITDFPDTYKKLCVPQDGLFLHGGRGIGKTWFMAALTREIILQSPPFLFSEFSEYKYKRNYDYTPIFLSVPELLAEIRDCYSNKNISEKKLLDKYSSIKILMLDDLGAEKTTEWVLEILYLIIDRRYRDMKRTIISSNLTLDQLSSQLGDRIASRIAGMCHDVQMTGKDRRL